ncbi:MAG TPA: VCBS repeat-containing protein [Thermoanaerobaculia bacterium]|nr:VCBS repeat-containing protein [Thermoanaerobaculia bacterium]
MASFAYDNGARGRLELLAIMGPGAALFDYDGDGDLDLFLPQGGTLPSDTDAATAASSGGGRLLRNDPQTSGAEVSVRFVDVTARAGLAAGGYGVAAAVGDYDGDGAPDLLLGTIGGDRLWRNRGDGSFVEETPEPLRHAGWTSGASFFDADQDGDLDLYVVDYVEPVAGVHCFAESSRPDYCGPAAYKPLPDRLLRNDGAASAGGPVRWTDLSGSSGIARAGGPGLGVIASDVDADGKLDLFVANDGQPNFLWRNGGGGRFADEGLLSGVALAREGLPRAGMGVEAGDLDGDGDEELFVTNLSGEGNTLYVNGGEALFEDRTAEAGLAAPSRPWTGFGAAFVDADLDGWLDLLVVNGAVRLAQASSASATDAARPETQLRQPAQLYRNRGGARFELMSSAAAGGAIAEPRVTRGLAVGDVDDDGDVDAVAALNDGAPRLWLAGANPAAGWVGVAPCPGAPDAPWLARTVEVAAEWGPPSPARTTDPGAQEWLASAAGLPLSALPAHLRRRPHRDGSYASARDPRVVIGFGRRRARAVELRGGAASVRTLRWLDPAPRSYLLWCPEGASR